MRKYIDLGIKSAGIGVLIGFFISIIFSYANHLTSYYPSTPKFIAHFVTTLDATVASIGLWILMGLLFGFGSLIFCIERWSLLKRTVVNCCVYYCGFVPLAILAGWFPVSIVNLIIFTVIFVIIYMIEWLVNYHATEKEIERINKQLKKAVSL